MGSINNLTPLKPKGDPYSDAVRQKRMVAGCSDKLREALQLRGSKRAKCKNCHLQCDFREACLLKDPEGVCVVPALRITAIRDKTRVAEFNDDRIKAYLNQLLELYTELCLRSENFEDTPKKKEALMARRLNTMFNRLLQFKEKYYPPVQKNLNVNVNMFEDQLKKWRKEREDIMEMMKEDMKDGKL